MSTRGGAAATTITRARHRCLMRVEAESARGAVAGSKEASLQVKVTLSRQRGPTAAWRLVQ
jgi:hypothetical protein